MHASLTEPNLGYSVSGHWEAPDVLGAATDAAFEIVYCLYANCSFLRQLTSKHALSNR